MGILDWLFPKKPQAKPEPENIASFDVPDISAVPFSLDFFDGKLKVNVRYKEVHIHSATHKCIVYETEGLAQAGQQEFVLILKNEANIYRIYKEIFIFYKYIYQISLKGEVVYHGGRTRFGPNGLLGAGGIMYVKMPEGVDNDFADNCLFLILLHPNEVTFVENFGFLRFATILASAYAHYPWPYWNDLARAPRKTEEIAELSILSKMGGAPFIRGAFVLQYGTEIILTLPKSLSQQDIPPHSHPIAFSTDLGEETNSCLTWSFEIGTPHSIAPTGSRQDIFGGCFLMLLAEQPQNSIKMVEDGFGILLQNDAWDGFWDAIKQKKDFLLAMDENNMYFHLRWNG